MKIVYFTATLVNRGGLSRAIPEKVFFSQSYKLDTFSYFAFAQGNPVVKSHSDK